MGQRISLPRDQSGLLSVSENLLGARVVNEGRPVRTNMNRNSSQLPDVPDADDVWVGLPRGGDVPVGFANFDFRIADLPETFRPVGFRFAVRRPSDAYDDVNWAFAHLPSEGLTSKNIRGVFENGTSPELFEPLMTLVKYRLLDLRKFTRGNELNPPDGKPSFLHHLAEYGMSPVSPRPSGELLESDGEPEWSPHPDDSPATTLAMRLERLKAEGIDLNVQDHVGRTPLHVAAAVNNHVALEALIEAGADLEVRCDVGMTPLLHAAKAGAFNTLEALLEAGANPNCCATDNTGFAPIHWAAMTRSGGQSALKVLLAHHADPMLQTRSGRTPLHVAIHGRQFRNAKLLLQNGADPNVVDIRGITPLHRACRNRDDQAIGLLLKHGADPNLDDGSGQKPLYVALWSFADLDSVRALLEAGASVSGQNRVYFKQRFSGLAQREHNRPALHFACDLQNTAPSIPLEREELHERLYEYGKLLLEFGADPNQPDLVTGDTAMHAAARFTNVKLIALMHRCGGKLEALNKSGKRPIDVAGSQGLVVTFNKFVELGCRPPYNFVDRSPGGYSGGGGM